MRKRKFRPHQCPKCVHYFEVLEIPAYSDCHCVSHDDIAEFEGRTKRRCRCFERGPHVRLSLARGSEYVA